MKISPMPAPIRGVCTLQTDMVSFTVFFELAGGSLSVHYTPCIEGENNNTKTTRTSSSCNDTIQPRRWPTMCTPLLLGRTDRCKQRGCPSGAPSLGFCGDRVQPDSPREWEGIGREKDISFCQRPAKSTHPLYCTSGFMRPLRKCCRLHRRLEWPWPFSEKKSAGHHYQKKKVLFKPLFFSFLRISPRICCGVFNGLSSFACPCIYVVHVYRLTWRCAALRSCIVVSMQPHNNGCECNGFIISFNKNTLRPS